MFTTGTRTEAVSKARQEGGSSWDGRDDPSAVSGERQLRNPPRDTGARPKSAL